MRRRAVLALVVLLTSILGPAAGAAVGQDRAGRPAPPDSPCDGPKADPWVTELRDRLLSFDLFAAHAIERYGEPVKCEGSVTTEFDGLEFGYVWLSFAGGVSIHAETMPPESSVVTLTVPSGFDDEDAARRVLRTYAANVGLEIDWSAPEATAEGRGRIERFWDPDPGLNGSASLIFVDDTLVALRLSLAL